MLSGNYEPILNLIAESSGLSREEVERRIEAKRAKLSGLISREGAAQIIASELGISFEKQKMKIAGLLSGMRRINAIGKIVKINKIIEYNKNGKSGKIASFLLGDETGNIRVVLWDTNHIALLEKGEIKEGDVVEISGGDVRNYELHLSGFADIKLSNVIMNEVKEKPPVHKAKIGGLKINENVLIRAFVVQLFGPSFFNTCPECGKRVNELLECIQHGKIVPKKGAVLTLIVDDGTGSIRAIIFTDQLKKIASEQELESIETFAEKRKELLGKEIILEGNIRKNRLTENLEIFVNDIKDIELDKLIEELEAKAT